MSDTLSDLVCYEGVKPDLNRGPKYECRYDERLKTKVEGSTRLSYTGLLIVYCKSIKGEFLVGVHNCCFLYMWFSSPVFQGVDFFLEVIGDPSRLRLIRKLQS